MMADHAHPPALPDVRTALRLAGPARPVDGVQGQCRVADRCACQIATREMTARSDGRRELVKGLAKSVAGGGVGGEFIVAAAEVLDERVPGGDDPYGPVTFQAAHRPQPGLQPAVIGLDRVVRVALDGVQR